MLLAHCRMFSISKGKYSLKYVHEHIYYYFDCTVNTGSTRPATCTLYYATCTLLYSKGNILCSSYSSSSVVHHCIVGIIVHHCSLH